MNCPYCGNTVNTNQKFCTSCGANLAEIPRQQPQQPTYQQPQQPAYQQQVNYQQSAYRSNQQQSAYRQKATPEVTQENFLLGILGAIGGAFLGGLSIVLLGRLGIIASLSGVLIAFLTVGGYKLLGKTLSTKGFIVCIILMLLTPYIADRADWAILVAQELYGYTFGEAYAAIPELIDRGAIESGVYIGNLLKLYLFTGIGALSMLRFRK